MPSPDSYGQPRRWGSSNVQRRHPITVSGRRRKKIDLHHLGRALLRLAQSQYDANQSSGNEQATPLVTRPTGAASGSQGAQPTEPRSPDSDGP
ncbi:hypothetical protein GCM10027414_05000 [Humibacter ginsengiterrae]